MCLVLDLAFTAIAGRYINDETIEKCFHIQPGFIRHSKDRIIEILTLFSQITFSKEKWAGFQKPKQSQTIILPLFYKHLMELLIAFEVKFIINF